MGAVATVELIPFTPGRRPTDEARHAWLGSSDQVAFVLGDPSVDNRCYLLLAINGIEGALDVTLERACRAGNAGRSSPPRSSRARRPRAHGRSATTARTSSRWLPTSSTSRSRSPGCGSTPRSAYPRGAVEDVAYGTSTSTTCASSGRCTRGSSSGVVDPGRGAPAGRARARLPPVVPGAADRLAQGRALHARADRGHRPQEAQPVRPGLARARRDLPRAADVPRDRRGGGRGSATAISSSRT